mgnify:CR=1 FL=1
MAQPPNTYDTYAAGGLREDLSDVIYRIDPTDVPFTSNIGRSKASAKYHEWQIQNLAAARDDNARIEGDDATNTQVTPAIRVGNRTQISDKVAQVTGTLEAVDKAGRDSEMEYQVLLKGLELKRDVEKQMLSNKPSVAGSSPVSIFMVVVLPQPLEPRKPKISPRPMRKLTWSTAVKLPNRFVRPRASIAISSSPSTLRGGISTGR